MVSNKEISTLESSCYFAQILVLLLRNPKHSIAILLLPDKEAILQGYASIAPNYYIVYPEVLLNKFKFLPTAGS